MYKGLYDIFKHWFHGGQVYFYSDPHFDEFTYRKDYIGDEEQVRRINSKIGKNDTIIILGDIGEKEFLKKIRGYKVLILGNHDSGASTYADYVDEVYSGPLMISNKILLSHEPINLPFVFNIHGHNHSNFEKQDNLHLNMCAELIDYTPVSYKDLVNKGTFKDVIDIHRITIDRASERKKF